MLNTIADARKQVEKMPVIALAGNPNEERPPSLMPSPVLGSMSATGRA